MTVPKLSNFFIKGVILIDRKVTITIDILLLCPIRAIRIEETLNKRFLGPTKHLPLYDANRSYKRDKNRRFSGLLFTQK